MSAQDSVLMVIPRWVRDGGVAAHIAASAQALAARGTRVAVLAAKVESEFVPPGARIFHSPELFNRDAPVEERLGEALSCEPTLVHLNQLGDATVVEFLRRSTPVVISAHGFVACTSGVHYFRPGHECMRAHGPGCVLNLPRCAHTRHPLSLRRVLRARRARAWRPAAGGHGRVLLLAPSTGIWGSTGSPTAALVPYFPTVTPAASERASSPRWCSSAASWRRRALSTLVRAIPRSRCPLRRLRGRLAAAGDAPARETPRRCRSASSSPAGSGPTRWRRSSRMPRW